MMIIQAPLGCWQAPTEEHSLLRLERKFHLFILKKTANRSKNEHRSFLLLGWVLKFFFNTLCINVLIEELAYWLVRMAWNSRFTSLNIDEWVLVEKQQMWIIKVDKTVRTLSRELL